MDSVIKNSELFVELSNKAQENIQGGNIDAYVDNYFYRSTELETLDFVQATDAHGSVTAFKALDLDDYVDSAAYSDIHVS